MVQCLRTGKQCVYIQSRRGRRPRNSAPASIKPLRPGIHAPEGTATSSNAPTQFDPDGYCCPDLLIDDNDAVFDSLLFNASYPFTPSLDLLIDFDNLQSPGVLRQYQCDHDM